MSRKLRALGLSLIAALAMSAMVAGNASAETGGTFTSGQAHTILTGADIAPGTVFKAFGQEVKCEIAKYAGTTTTTPTTEVTITPTYEKCTHSVGPAHVRMNGCDYLFTVRGDSPSTKDNTVHLNCPSGTGPLIEVTGPLGNCKIEVTANQTPAGGVVYKTGGSGNTHDITADVTASGIHAVIKEGGFFQCGTFASTDAAATLDGEATLQGSDTAGNPVGITANGK